MVCVLLMVSCGPRSIPTPAPTAKSSPVPTATPAPMREEWRNRWLHGIPCRAPCWEGVTPGETSLADALRIWSENELMRNVRAAGDGLRPNWGEVVWNWTSNIEGGFAPFDKGSPTQQVLGIQVALPRVYDLNEVIAAYGTPRARGRYCLMSAGCTRRPVLR
jgi:hypothetical protein